MSKPLTDIELFYSFRQDLNPEYNESYFWRFLSFASSQPEVYNNNYILSYMLVSIDLKLEYKNKLVEEFFKHNKTIFTPLEFDEEVYQAATFDDSEKYSQKIENIIVFKNLIALLYSLPRIFVFSKEDDIKNFVKTLTKQMRKESLEEYFNVMYDIKQNYINETQKNNNHYLNIFHQALWNEFESLYESRILTSQTEKRIEHKINKL